MANPILKAIDRLIKAGYPEGTAKKIATGELPMDFNSRMNRAREQGFRTEAYHTGDPNILEFNPDAGFGDRHGGGSWFSQEPEISASYTKPESAAYRVLLDDSKFAQVDAGGANWNDLPYEANMYFPKSERFPEGKDYTLEDLEYILQENVIDSTDKVSRAARDMGAPGVEIAQVHDLGGNYPIMSKVIKDNNPDIDKADWINDYELTGGTNYSVQDPSKIRSYYGAAFDPDNKGLPNILGSAVPVGVLAALGGGAYLSNARKQGNQEYTMPSMADVREGLSRSQSQSPEDVVTPNAILEELLGFFAPTSMGDATMDAYNRNRVR